MRRAGLALLFGIFIFSLSSRGDVPSSLSWQECIDLASRNNGELKSALATLQSNENLIGVARNGFLPQVSANLGYNRGNVVSSTSGSLSSPSAIGGVISQNTLGYSASLSGSQNLFSGLQDFGKIQQAKANAEAASANLKIVKAKVSYDLKSAFQGLIYAKTYQKLTRDIIQRREDNLKLVQMRFESGRENQGSVLLSRAYLNQAKYDDLQARNAEKVAQAQLARVLGEDEWLRVSIRGEIPTQDVNVNDSPDFRALAMSTPDFEQAKAQEESAESAITIARSQFFPTLAVTGTAGRTGTTFFPEQTTRWTVSVNVTIPIFNGGRDYFSTKSAISTWMGTVTSRENISRQVLAKLEQAYASYIESILKYQVDDSFQQAAGVRAEIARTKYNNGLLSFEDWDIIENDLISRQKVFLQSKRDRVIYEAAWEQTQGKGVIP